jgi:oligopeptide/dipeptide ABC transporter ATP-binding protein
VDRAGAAGTDAVMLRARGLTKDYEVRGGAGVVRALAGVDLDLAAGETLGIVGESGCGKSTLAKLLVRLEEPTSGSVHLDSVDLLALRGRRLRSYRRRIQMVFQDPYSALNPRLTVGRVLDEVLAVHGLARGDKRIAALLDMVGLDARLATSYPHELSGGQRQRVGIARALAVEPAVLVLDEPVSALDVSVRAEIMNLLRALRDSMSLSYIFISHDVAMVRHISDRVAVMYLGRFVEQGGWKSVLDAPRHPYTAALCRAVPVPVPSNDQPITSTVTGEVPDPADPPPGCPFHPRCPLAEDVCLTTDPTLLELAPQHRAACHVAARSTRTDATGGPPN